MGEVCTKHTLRSKMHSKNVAVWCLNCLVCPPRGNRRGYNRTLRTFRKGGVWHLRSESSEKLTYIFKINWTKTHRKPHSILQICTVSPQDICTFMVVASIVLVVILSH